VESTDGHAVSAIADVVNVVEPQNVGCEGSQTCKDAWIAANATVVFAEAAVTDVMRSILDGPMISDGSSAERGGQDELAGEVGDFAGRVPHAGGRGAFVDGARDAHDCPDVIGPFGVGKSRTRVEHFNQAGFVPRSAFLIPGCVLIDRSFDLA
jgi:hypothetical protein